MDEYDLKEMRGMDYAIEQQSQGKAVTNKDLGARVNLPSYKPKDMPPAKTKTVREVMGKVGQALMPSVKVMPAKKPSMMGKPQSVDQYLNSMKPKVRYPGNYPGKKK